MPCPMLPLAFHRFSALLDISPLCSPPKSRKLISSPSSRWFGGAKIPGGRHGATHRMSTQANHHRRPAPIYQPGQTGVVTSQGSTSQSGVQEVSPLFVGPFTVECIVNPSVVRLRLPSFLGFQGAEAMAGEGNRSNQQKQEQVCQYQSATTLTPYNQNPLIILCWIVSTYSQCLLTFSQAQFLYIVGKNLPLLILVQTATCSFG